MIRMLAIAITVSATPALAQIGSTAGMPADGTPTSGYNPSSLSISGGAAIGYGGASGYGASTGYAPGGDGSAASSTRGRFYSGSLNAKTGKYTPAGAAPPASVESRAVLDTYSITNNTGIVNGGATYDPH